MSDTHTANADESPSSNLTYGRWSADANKLPPKSVAYCLQNGFSQSMTDAAAFTKKQKEDAVAGHPIEEHADILAKMADEAREKRFQAILRGEVGVRVGGPRKSPLDRAMDDIVDEKLRAHVDAVNAANRASGKATVAMPKGDVLTKARAAIRQRYETQIRELAEQRVAQSAALADDASIGDILGS